MSKKRLSILLVSFLTVVAPVMAEFSVSKGLFQRGRTRASVSGALGTAFDQEYFVMGLGMGYYLADGLELGLNGEAWWGENPNIYKLSPQLTYVFLQVPGLTPYIGGFYRRTYFESVSDLDSYGGRAGLFSQMGKRGYAGVGLVYEKYTDCDDRTYSSCSSTYPEFMIGASF